MAKINLQNIKKSYGNNTVIHNLSADIADGELIVIVGPSRSEERRVGKECRSRWSPYH